MFFGGGKGSSITECTPDQLMPLLNEQFSRKLSGLDSRCVRLVNGISSSRDALAAACDDFGNLASEPDMEYAYVTSTTYLKDMKGSYVTALKRVLSSGIGESVHPTKYHRYEAELAAAEEMINGILRTNKTFKLVLDGYANHLDRFKKAFSAIESYTGELRAQVALHTADKDQYNELQGRIEHLAALTEEHMLLRSQLAELGNSTEPDAGSLPESVDAARKSIDAKKAEIDGLSGEIATASAGASVMLAQIEKAARKHDHLSASKVKLSSFIEDKRLVVEHYQEFLVQVDALGKEIDDGKVAVKNKEEAMRAVRMLKSGGLIEQLERVKALEDRRSAAEAQIREFEKVEREFSAIESRKKEGQAAMQGTKLRLERTAEDMEAEKTVIEQLFAGYYKKQIRILLAAR